MKSNYAATDAGSSVAMPSSGIGKAVHRVANMNPRMTWQFAIGVVHARREFITYRPLTTTDRTDRQADNR